MRQFIILALLWNSTAVAAVNCDHVPGRLASMVETDQAVRKGHSGQADKLSRNEKAALSAGWEAVDAANLAELKQLLISCGWPTEMKASHDAWLLAQHADRDIAFQRHAKSLLAAAVAKGHGAGADLAYLSDRIALAEGRPQEYGTQFRNEGRCKLELAPVDDIEQVEARRRAVGLPNVATYLGNGRKVLLPADCQ